MRHTGEKLWRWRWFRLRDWERFKVQGGGLEKSWWESRAPSPPSAFLFLLHIWLMSRALQCMARLHRGLTGPQVRTLGRPKWKGKKIEKTWDGGLAVFFFACHRPAICLSALQRWYHCFFCFTWHMHQSHTDDDDDETQNESIYFFWKDPRFVPVPVVEDWCDKVRAEGKEENKLCELWNWRGSKCQRVVNKSWSLPVGRWTGCCIALIPWASGNTLESL